MYRQYINISFEYVIFALDSGYLKLFFDSPVSITFFILIIMSKNINKCSESFWVHPVILSFIKVHFGFILFTIHFFGY